MDIFQTMLRQEGQVKTKSLLKKKKISSLRNPLNPPSQCETFDENDFRKNRLTLVSQTS